MHEMSYSSESAEPAGDTRHRTKIWMIVSQLIAGLILIPWFFLLLFAGMIGWPAVIEAEGGWDFLSVIFSLMLCYPVLAAVPLVGAWILYATRHYTAAAIATGLPILMTLIGLLFWRIAG